MSLFGSDTTTKPVIFGPAKDIMKDVLRDAGGYYDWIQAGDKKKNLVDGVNVRAYVNTLPTTVGFGTDTNAALSGLSSLSTANSGDNGMAPHLQQIMSNGGFTNDQLRSMGVMEGMVGNRGLNDIIEGDGLTDAQRGAFEELQNTVGGNNADFQRTFNQGGLTDDQRRVADFYRTDMNEAFDPNTIPGYSQVRSRTLDAGANAVAGQAAKMGRLGGAANQGILARTQMDTAGALDNAEYDKWRGRRTGAAGGLAALGEAGKNSQLGINSAQIGGLGAVAEAGQRGVDNRNTALSLKGDMNNNLFNAQASGLDRMGKAYDTAQKPYQTQMGVGQMRDAERQSVRDDEIRQFQERDPMALYAKMMALANGTPLGSTATTNPSLAQLLTAGGLGALSLPSLFGWGGSTGSTTTGMTG